MGGILPLHTYRRGNRSCEDAKKTEYIFINVRQATITLDPSRSGRLTQLMRQPENLERIRT